MFKDEYEALDCPVGFGDSIGSQEIQKESFCNEEDWI